MTLPEAITTDGERAGDDPDAVLVASAKGGDRAAFGKLLERHYDRMHRVAWRITGSSHDAEDIVQEVCCALPGKLDGFRGEARFTTWLTGIVTNACLDHRRRAGALSRLKDRFSFFAPKSGGDGRDLYAGTWIASTLAKLPQEIRDTIVLVAGEGMSHEEAGQALGVAANTISWRLHMARKKLLAMGVNEVLNAR